MTKFKTLRGLAGYLVRQEGKMTAKKSRAKIGDTMQMLGVLSDLHFAGFAEETKRTMDDAYYFVMELKQNFTGSIETAYLLVIEGAKRWKRAQKLKK